LGHAHEEKICQKTYERLDEFANVRRLYAEPDPPKARFQNGVEIAWLNIFRVRALCIAIHGYDEEMENWDQTPFHNNEIGSADVNTLAVSGTVVHLVEGHADTRKRWTANLVTFSDKERRNF